MAQLLRFVSWRNVASCQCNLACNLAAKEHKQKLLCLGFIYCQLSACLAHLPSVCSSRHLLCLLFLLLTIKKVMTVSLLTALQFSLSLCLATQNTWPTVVVVLYLSCGTCSRAPALSRILYCKFYAYTLEIYVHPPLAAPPSIQTLPSFRNKRFYMKNALELAH